MSRPAFDPRLFLAYDGAGSLLFALPGTIDLAISLRPFADRLTDAVAAYAASGFLGVMLYGGLREAGYRCSRPPVQVEDYDDGPRTGQPQ